MKLRYIIAGIVIILFMPVLVEGLVNIPIPSIAKADTWIGFFGSFLGALIGASAIIFITLHQINSNKELEIYKEDIKDLTFLILIEKLIHDTHQSLFTDIFSPILEQYRRHAQNESLTVKDLEKYFSDLSAEIFNNITIKDKFKLSFSYEDLGIEEKFDGKEFFGIEKLSIADNLFNVNEKHYEWATHLDNDELINGYFEALGFIESIKKEFSKNNEQEVNKIVVELIESDMYKIVNTSINPEQIKEVVRKQYWKSLIKERFTFFLFCFIRKRDLFNLLQLVRKEIAIKNKRIKSYRIKYLK